MKSLLTILILVPSVLWAQAPTISVDFYVDGKPLDKSPVGPYVSVRIGETVRAYVVVEHADMMIGGASFRISETNSRLLVTGTGYAPGLVVGDLWSGVEIGLSEPVPQFGEDKAVLAWFDLFALDLTTWEYFPMPIIGEDAPLIAASSGALVEAQGVPGMVAVRLQPQMGLFFDEAGTSQTAQFIGGDDEFRSLWLMIRDLDAPIDWAALSLDLPPSLTVVSSTPAAGVTLDGDWTTGMSLLFDPPLAAPGMTAVPMAEIVVSLGHEYLFDAVLTLGGHEGYDAYSPFVVVSPIGAYGVTRLPASLTIPIGNESRTMSELKALYR